MDFHDVSYWGVLPKFVYTFKFSSKLDKISGQFTKTSGPTRFYAHLERNSLNAREIFLNKSYRENGTHFMRSTVVPYVLWF
jgi:hypothetical protein